MSDSADIAALAALLRQRNEVDARIGGVIGRPMTAGHAGEWIAARIFDIELEPTAVAKAIDGRFRSGPLMGRSVNVKWYLKRDGLLDMTQSPELDYYLVLTGPKATGNDHPTLRPWVIASAHLFDAAALLESQRERGVRAGTATSVREALWHRAEVHPASRVSEFQLSPSQRTQLDLFAPDMP